MWECLDSGGEWVNAPANFDSFIDSALTLFIVITSEGWVGIMWQGVDATFLHHMPIRNNFPPACLFFVMFMIAGAVFLINLFVGVVLANYSEQKRKLLRDHMLT